MTTEIICTTCDSSFVYTDAEREFRHARGLPRPEMCTECRHEDRKRRNGDLMSMYLRTDSFDPFLLGENTQAGGLQRGNREIRSMHSATCANCGSETRVPFVPRGDRPVYCKDCFNARRGR